MSDIFVVGSPRSGGTLLYNIICADPGVNPALKENHFVSVTLANYSFMKSRVEMEDGHFLDLDATKQFYARWIRAFLDEIHHKYSDVARIAIKSIALAPDIVLLHELLPEIRYCMSVRDPRDIVASMIEVGLRQQKKGLRPQYPRDARYLATQVMRHYMPAIVTNSGEFQKMIAWIKYETMVRDTDSVISRLEKDLGLDLSRYDPEQPWPRSKVDIRKYKKADAPFFTGLWGGKISTASVGKYERVLDRDEVAVVKKICSPLMQLFGYEF